MSALRMVQELPTHVVFPQNAPAGWVVATAEEAARAEKREREVARNQREFEMSRAVLREYSAQLFVGGIGDGLSASESADVLIQDERYVALREQFNGWCKRVSPRPNSADVEKTFPRELLYLGSTLKAILAEGLRLESWIRRTIAHLKPEALRIPASATDFERAKNHLWFTSDPVLPDCVIRGMLASHRAYGMAATLDALVHRRTWDLQHIVAAGKLWRDESRRYLTLLASIPTADVPKSIVPVGDRFDLDRAFHEQRALLADIADTAA